MHNPGNPTEPPAPPSEATFPQIPGYRFQRRLGKGGMASVYLATQESLDRPVSIKVMAREALQDETSKQRFENEARTIARLSHSGIVGIHEVGRTADGQMYYVMPYLPNGDLAQRDLRHDETRIKEILRSLLAALGYAHSHGIVHRDVKEENVLFDSHDRPLLTDFGIARSKRDTSRLTSAGFSVGSAAFMAPEQARGEEVDGRADLYSVGVLTYALVAGQLPFRSPDPLAMALMHAHDAVPRLPPEKSHWQGFIDRAMAKAPAQRFVNAQQMLEALDRVGHEEGGLWSGRIQRAFAGVAANFGGKERLALLALAAGLLIAASWYATHVWFASSESAVASSSPQSATKANAATDVSPPVVAPASPSTAAATETSSEAAPDTSTPATEPESVPTQTAASKPQKTTTAEQPPPPPPDKPSTISQKKKKIKDWFSRVFRHR